MNAFFPRVSVFILLVVLLFLTATAEPSPFRWENPPPSAYPGAYWFWPGSAVSAAELERSLQQLSEVGIKTLRLCATYAAEGSRLPVRKFLSDEWNDGVRKALEVADAHGVTIDFWGNGWPYGGPMIQPGHAARRLIWDNVQRDRVISVTRTLVQDSGPPIIAVVLTAPGDGTHRGVMARRIRTESGQDAWSVPPGCWDVYVFRNGFAEKEVERAAPGGEGPALDPYYRPALEDYLNAVDKLLTAVKPYKFETTHKDSFEVDRSNWTGIFPDFFRKRRGYDLLPFLPLLISDSTSETAGRIRHDYRQTLQEIHIEQFLKPWIRWAHRYGMRTSYQAHGTPGHLIDLYGVSDQPDTEAFGKHGMRTRGGGTEEGGYFCSKFASSAAHLNGRPFTSSETFTWLDEHFHVSLDRMRRDIDFFFLAGVNRVYFHSTTYSPGDVPWPGWLYYASTHVDPCQSWWKHLPYFNAYITRIQTVLQQGLPGEDVLLLYPIHDLWFTNEGSINLLQYSRVHNTSHWLWKVAGPTMEIAEKLWDEGWQFDWCSDETITRSLQVDEEGFLVSGHGRYRALIIPPCRWVDSETPAALERLVRSGATVLVLGEGPQAVPTGSPEGASSVGRSDSLKSLLGGRTDEGKGKIEFVRNLEDLELSLNRAGSLRESMTDLGIRCIRRSGTGETWYFLKNVCDRPFAGWLPLACRPDEVVVGDPLTVRTGRVLSRVRNGKLEVNLYLPAEGTRVLRIGPLTEDFPLFPRKQPVRETLRELEGPWFLTWTGPKEGMEKHDTLDRLDSWTRIPDLTYFSGTVVYETTVSLSGDDLSRPCFLDLGTLKESADVFVNGKHVGCLWTIPYRVEVSDFLRPGGNTIRIEVTNLIANRIIALEKSGTRLRDRHFFVNYRYDPFDATGWDPLPSGLLGPVRLLRGPAPRN